MSIVRLPMMLLLAILLNLQPALGDEPKKLVSGAKKGIISAFSYECDDACLLPGAPVPPGKYAVVSPVGKQTIRMISQAPRLDSLDGKTIAVVGGSFMANVTHPEIKRLILENYPSANVLLLSEIGFGGPFPGPGV